MNRKTRSSEKEERCRIRWLEWLDLMRGYALINNDVYVVLGKLAEHIDKQIAQTPQMRAEIMESATKFADNINAAARKTLASADKGENSSADNVR